MTAVSGAQVLTGAVIGMALMIALNGAALVVTALLLLVGAVLATLLLLVLEVPTFLPVSAKSPSICQTRRPITKGAITTPGQTLKCASTGNC